MNFLTKKELKEYPVLFSNSASESVSTKYTQIPTYKLMNYFEKIGWLPVEVNVQKARQGISQHSRHVVKFQNQEYSSVNDITPQLYLSNSHNRSCGTLIGIGFYRMICSNGLIVAHDDLLSETIRTRHIGITFPEFKKEVQENVIKFDKYIKEIKRYKTIELTKSEKGVFAHTAKNLRFGVDSVIEPSLLLNPKRDEDKKNDLWTVFNVIQENAIKGGLIYVIKDYKDHIRNMTTKELKTPYYNTKLNQELWTIMAGIYANKVRKKKV